MGSSDWKLEELIRQEDEGFEEQLAKKRGDFTIWLAYYQSKGDDDVYGKIFILERAVRSARGSVELWLVYLELVLELAKELSYYHNKNQFEMINRIFDRALHALPDNLEIWMKYLKYLVDKTSEVSRIRQLFNRCLVQVDAKFHSKIWPMYLEFADKIGGITGSKIYQQYLQYEPKDIADVVDELKAFDEYEAYKFYTMVLENPGEYNLSSSLLELWKDYIDLQFEIGLTKEDPHWDSQFEAKVKFAIAKFPDQLGKFYMTLTGYMTNRGFPNKSRYYFDLALKSCSTIPDFVMIYNDYVDFEQEELTILQENEASDDEFRFRLNYYENLLSNHGLLFNDARLRHDINDLDVWFDRLQLFKDDLDNTLKTYVMALTRINPIHSHSSSNNSKNRFSRLWIDYANVYASKGDFNTANVVFNKATTSTFPSTHQLGELYIKWSEMMLESPNDPEDKAIAVIENVLMKPSKNDTEKLRESSQLWNYYFELLESLVDDVEESKESIDRFVDGYDKCIKLKLATPQMLLNLADTLHSWNRLAKSYTVYERGLEVFPDDIINSRIWSVYIKHILEDKVDVERILNTFDECLFSGDKKIAGHLCKPITLLYVDYLETKEPGYKVIGILRKIIKRLYDSAEEESLLKAERDQVHKDKYDLYEMLISKVGHLNETSFKREIFEEILNDGQLRLDELIRFSNELIDFEIMEKSFKRTRALFEHITSLTNPQSAVILPVWDKWESFELEYGDEQSFKEMARLKRQLMKEFENEGSFKNSLNPMGFIKSNTVNGVKEPTTDINPDQIDIDMDM